MKRVARIVVAAYALAILIAGLGPHCAWMFPSAQAGTAQSAHTEHAQSGHDDHSAPIKKSDRDCAAMEMAKAVGPLPGVLVLTTPDFSITAAVLPEPPAFTAPLVISSVEPRGPPRTSGGFAAVFAINHRLLI